MDIDAAPPPVVGAKRTPDISACDVDHSAALKVLQSVLPMLRPHQGKNKASLSASVRLSLLIQEWVTQAKAHSKLAASDAAAVAAATKGVGWSAKRNFKSEMGDTWFLIEHASPEEKADLEFFVLQLASSEGRSMLIREYDAHIESAAPIEACKDGAPLRCALCLRQCTLITDVFDARSHRRLVRRADRGYCAAWSVQRG